MRFHKVYADGGARVAYVVWCDGRRVGSVSRRPDGWHATTAAGEAFGVHPTRHAAGWQLVRLDDGVTS